MTHEQTSAMWLTRWQGFRSSVLKMTEYARREGFNAHSAYRWLRQARRSGQWCDSAAPSGKAITLAKPAPAVQFARVAVSDSAIRSAVLLRLVLTNGRRAELEIGSVAQLGEVARDAGAARVIRPIATAVVYLCVAPTDLRKQAASLALLVEQSLKRDVFAPALYVFSTVYGSSIALVAELVADFAPGYVFMFFAGMMVLQLMWVKTMVVETKGVALEHMDARMRGG